MMVWVLSASSSSSSSETAYCPAKKSIIGDTPPGQPSLDYYTDDIMFNHNAAKLYCFRVVAPMSWLISYCLCHLCGLAMAGANSMVSLEVVQILVYVLYYVIDHY